MRISFYEEFPTKENLDKLKLIHFPTTIYVASESVEEFSKIIKNIKKVNFAYWPVLKKEEGYWLSPFSSTKALKRIISDIENSEGKLKIMWDAELPFRHPWLFLRVDNFLRNKIIIKKFFESNGQNILTSEYPVKNRLVGLILKHLGVSFSPEKYKNKKIVMYYSSLHKFISPHMLINIRRLNKKYGKNLQVALGTIAPGILGDEPILKPKDLEKDLKQMKKIGTEEVVIFRLGGLNKKYVSVLNKFI